MAAELGGRGTCSTRASQRGRAGVTSAHGHLEVQRHKATHATRTVLLIRHRVPFTHACDDSYFEVCNYRCSRVATTGVLSQDGKACKSRLHTSA